MPARQDLLTVIGRVQMNQKGEKIEHKMKTLQSLAGTPSPLSRTRSQRLGDQLMPIPIRCLKKESQSG